MVNEPCPLADRRAVGRTLAHVLDAMLGGCDCAPEGHVPVQFRACFVGDPSAYGIASAGELTPYAAEILADDARWAGAGRLDLFLGAAPLALRTRMRHQVAQLQASGIDVRIHD